MGDSLWTFAFEIANFVMLAALLSWFFFKPVRKAIEKQQNDVHQIEEQAKSKLAYAETLENELNQQRQSVTQELEHMRLSARASASEESERILANARAEVDRELDQIRIKALQIDQAQARHLAQFIAIKTTVAINKLLADINGPKLESALISAAVRQLETFSGEMLAPVSVASATELEDTVKQQLCAAVGQPINAVAFHVLPELIGGVRISTAQGLIDASISGLSRYTEQELTESSNLSTDTSS